MSRYIDADAFEKYFDREEWRTPDEKWWPEREIGMVLDLVSKSDVVEVVRCKDCKNWDAPYCSVLDDAFDEKFFCALGERRKKVEI